MTALLVGAPRSDRSAFQRADMELQAQGLGSPRRLDCGEALVHWYPGYSGNPPDDAVLERADGFVACAGTLFYRERSGRAALEALWQDFDNPSALGADDPWGNYALAISKAGRLWVFGDRLGMVRLYENSAAGLLGTSWLACAAAEPRPALDRLGALDYVLSGAGHGSRTPVRQVRLIDATQARDVLAGRDHAFTTPAEWFAHPAPAGIDDAIDEAAQLLRARARTIDTAFPDRIRCALSGGFDSRLLLASLLSVGARPSLHVYGREGDEDVEIAGSVATSIGLPLRHVDKAALVRGLPALNADGLASSTRFFDGLPIDGAFDRGPDRQTRLDQSADGCIALNGGGGEVLRNFFYLSDRSFTVRQVVQTFYGNHDPRVARNPSDLHDHAQYLEESIAAQLGHGGKLSRTEVEAVYPLFRCRFWTARNNTMAARCGHFMTPLLDPALVRLGLSLPLRWKDYGRFEGMLIAALDPVLGAASTAYGFAPAEGPPRAYTARMWLLHRRPPWLRARTVRIKRLLGKLPAPALPQDAQALLAPPYSVESIIDLSRLVDDEQVERALTLEHLIRTLGIG